MKKEVERMLERNSNYSPQETIIRSLIHADSARKKKHVFFGPSGMGGYVGLSKAYKVLSESHLSEEEEIKYTRMIQKRAERLVKQAETAYRNSGVNSTTIKEDKLMAAENYFGAKDLLEKISSRGKSYKSLDAPLATASIIGFLGGIFFLSPNFTGNVIGNLTNSTSNILGAVLLVVGLIGSFFWLRSR
jgi:hypothetical protein